MVRGWLQTHTGLVTRALTQEQGLGSRMLFVSDDGQRTRLDMTAISYRCDQCSTIVVPGDQGDSDALKCFECETEIPRDATACPKCGWSW